MANLQKVIKLTAEQYNTLASGGTVGDYTGLDSNYMYLVQDPLEKLPLIEYEVATTTLGDLPLGSFALTKSGSGKKDTWICTKTRVKIGMQNGYHFIAHNATHYAEIDTVVTTQLISDIFENNSHPYSSVVANPQTTSATLTGITIDNISYSIQGGVTDVQINGTSILTDTIANFTTKTAYNASTNKIVTESDLTQVKRYI